MQVQDRDGHPIRYVRIQVFPGSLNPDSNTAPIPPDNPRADGLVGFVTDEHGKIGVEVSPGAYTVVAFSEPSFGGINERFMITRNVDAPGEVNLSLMDTVPVTVEAISESERGVDSQPLIASNIYFRPSKRSRGFVGLLDNEGKLNASISRGRYHLIIAGGFTRHYLVLTNQVVSPPMTTIRFDGTLQPTAQLTFDFPPNTVLSLHEVLTTDRSYEFVDATESQIGGYDAAYTEILSLGIGSHTSTTRLQTNLTYQLNLSYVVDVAGVSYAYELRVNTLNVDAPREYLIGNNGDQPFTLVAQTDSSKYHPGDQVTIRYPIFDTRGNQFYRFFNFSAARLVFPFVVVRDPTGTVVGSNPMTSQRAEEFFEFSFRLPPSAQPGEYNVSVSCDTKIYGQLVDEFTFRVTPPEDSTPPIIKDLKYPKKVEANTPIQISAWVKDDTVISELTIVLSPQSSIEIPPPSRRNNIYEWEIPASIISGERLGWEISALDPAGNRTTKSRAITIHDTTPPTLEHTPIRRAEVGFSLPLLVNATDNVTVRQVIVAYKNARVNNFTHQELVQTSVFNGIVPSSMMVGDQLDYFLQATDGAGNTRRLPDDGVFTVQLQDATPPRIYHAQISEPTDGPTPIEAVAIDNDGIDRVELNYRHIGEVLFANVQMTAEEGTFTASIPASVPLPVDAEYFLEVFDLADNSSRLPEAMSNAESPTYWIRSRFQVEQLTILPSASEEKPIEIHVATKRRFQLRATDSQGRVVPEIPIWNVTNEIGEIDQDGQFFAGAHAGRIGKIIATLPLPDEESDELVVARQVFTWVQVTPGPAYRLIIKPHSNPLLLASGTRQPFYAFIFDRYDNPRTEAVRWETAGDIGQIIAVSAGDGTDNAVNQATFHAEIVGRGRVIAHAENLQASTEIEVTFGRLVGIKVIPPVLQIDSNDRHPISAIGVDSSGNLIPIVPLWRVHGGVGKVRNGDFIASVAGKGGVVGTVGDVTATMPVRVLPGKLRSITIDPSVSYLPASTEQHRYTHQFIASGWDGWNSARNPVVIQDLRWTIDATSGQIDSTGLMQSINTANAQTLGNIVINGTVWASGTSAEGSKSRRGKGVVVIQSQPPGPIRKLQLNLTHFDQSLKSLTLAVGESQLFEAVGLDGQNGRIPVLADWSIVGDMGVVQPDGLCIAMRPGLGHLVTTNQGYTAQVQIEVTPGALDSLTINPPLLTLLVGESAQLRLSGTDAFGNGLPIDQHHPVWSLATPLLPDDPDPKQQTADVNENGFVTALYPGSAQITAAIGNIVAQMQLLIYPNERQLLAPPTIESNDVESSMPNPGFLKVHPNPLELELGRTQPFRAYSRNGYGEWVEITDLQWNVTNGLGPIDLHGEFTAEQRGEGHIVASYDGRTGRAYINVSDRNDSFTLNNIIIVPQNVVRLTVGQAQSFYTLGVFSSSGRNPSERNLRPTLTSWRVSGGIGVIDGMGRFVAVTPGEGKIRATLGHISTARPVRVEPGPVIEARVDLTPILEDIPHFGRQTGELVEFHVMPASSASVLAGNSLRFTAFGIDSSGNRSDATPTWELVSDTDIGHIQTNGLFIANHVGTGYVTARLIENQLPAQHIVVEVSPNRPVFARLEPPEIVAQGPTVGDVQLELIAFDQRGNRVNLLSDEVIWQTVGDIGTVSTLAEAGTAIFNPARAAPHDGVGEIIATIPSLNLHGRTRVFRYGMTDDIVQARISPDDLELPVGESYQFHWVCQDATGRIVESRPTWTVTNADTGMPLASISGDGRLSIDDTVPTGTTLRVRGETAFGQIQAEASIRVVPAPIERLRIENLADTPILEIGDRIRLHARGLDSRGNVVILNPMSAFRWSVNPTDIGEIEVETDDASEGTFTALQPGNGEIQVSGSGLFATSVFSVLPMSPGVNFRIELASSTTPTRGTSLANNPLVIQSGTELSFVGLNGKEVVHTTWKLSAETKGENLGSISKDGILSAQFLGNGVVRGEYNGVSSQVFLSIVPGRLAVLDVTPSIGVFLSKPGVSATPGQFSVKGFDLYGNRIPTGEYAPLRWSVTGGIGMVNEQGLFTPTSVSVGRTITGTLAATTEGIYGSASVTIIAEIGELATLELIASRTTVTAGTSTDIQLIGRDLAGNPFPAFDAPILVRLSPKIGRMEGDGDRWRYQAPQILPSDPDRKINLHAETSSGTLITSPEIELSLIPASLVELELAPKSTRTHAGDTEEFQLLGTDRFGNSIDLGSSSEKTAWRLSDALGKLTNPSQNGTTFTAQQAGRIRLTASVRNVETAAAIEIIPGAIVGLRISPETALLSAGKAVHFEVTGLDGHDNPVNHLQASWQVIGFGDSEILEQAPHFPNRRLWRPERAGSGHIEAHWTDTETGKTFMARSQLQVGPGKLASLQIDLIDGVDQLASPYRLTSGGKYELIGTGFDEFDNPIDIDPTWHITGNLGRIVMRRGDKDALPFLEATFVGEGSLISSVEDMKQTLSISVQPAATTIGVAGGHAHSPTGAVIDLPKDALGKDRLIEIAFIEPPGTALTTMRITGVLEIQPRKLILKRPAQLTLSYADAITEAFHSSQLSLYFWDDFQENWIQISSTVNQDSQTVTASVNHFAAYTIMASETVIYHSEELQIDNLQLTPPILYSPANNRVTIEYTLTGTNIDCAEVTITIFNVREEPVRTLLESEVRQIGANAEQWDGLKDDGEAVHNGRYILLVLASTGARTAAAKKLLVVFK